MAANFNFHLKNHAQFHIKRYAILNTALRMPKQTVLTVIYVFLTNQDVNSDNSLKQGEHFTSQ